MRKLASTAPIGFLLWACSSHLVPDSQTKHSFGKLENPSNQGKARNFCVQEEYELVGSDSPNHELLTMQQQAAGYLKDISSELMERVNASLRDDGRRPLFVDDLDPDRFCYTIAPTTDLPVNASISPLDLSIDTRPAIFTHLSGESALASVICHELAHASLFHGQDDIKPEIRRAIIKNNEDELMLAEATDILRRFGFLTVDNSIVEKLFGKNSEKFLAFQDLIRKQTSFINTRLMPFFLGAIISEQEELNNIFLGHANFQMVELFKDDLQNLPDSVGVLSAEEVEQWEEFMLTIEGLVDDHRLWELDDRQGFSTYGALSYLNEISDALNKAYGMGDYAYLNWMETEADEVGLELCIRAGVASDDFDELHRFTLENKEQAEKALSQCLDSIENGDVPERTTSTHPSSCRRIYDITIKEKSAHLDEYNELKKRHPVRPLKSTDEFQRIKRLVEGVAK